MLPEPLHPVLVHFPIVLGACLPLLAAYGLIASRRSPKPRAWLAVVIVAALALLSALAAQQAGEREEDRVEAWVPEAALEGHEEKASRFLWSVGAVFGCSLLGLGPARTGRAGRALTLIVALPMVALLVYAGESGGDLVYEHGAAAAYVGKTELGQDHGSYHYEDD